MNKVYYLTIFIILLVISMLGITFSYEIYDNNDTISFKLIGSSLLYLDVNGKYNEYGCRVMYRGNDVSNDVIVSGDIDTGKLGEYNVKYQYNNEYVYRKVIIVDRTEPVIKLIGGEEVYLLLGDDYEEPGYTVSDNYDTDLNDKVSVSGKVDINQEGKYTITYTVTDSSGNVGRKTRKVIVKKQYKGTYEMSWRGLY